MTDQPYKEPKFPDLHLEKMLEQIKSKLWANCPNPECGWFYKQSVLERCPMCRHPWKLGKKYIQPPYEGPSLT